MTIVSFKQPKRYPITINLDNFGSRGKLAAIWPKAVRLPSARWKFPCDLSPRAPIYDKKRHKIHTQLKIKEKNLRCHWTKLLCAILTICTYTALLINFYVGGNFGQQNVIDKLILKKIHFFYNNQILYVAVTI